MMRDSGLWGEASSEEGGRLEEKVLEAVVLGVRSVLLELQELTWERAWLRLLRVGT